MNTNDDIPTGRIWGMWLLDQDEVWVTAYGEELPLTAMTPDHRRNVVAWLLIHEELVRRHGFYRALDDVASPANERAGWIENTTLVRRLRDLQPDAPDVAAILARVAQQGDAWRCCVFHDVTWAELRDSVNAPVWAETSFDAHLAALDRHDGEVQDGPPT